MTKENVIAIPRIGNVQVVMTMRGEGPMERPVARINKLVSEEDIARDPTTPRVWEMHELVALRDVLGVCIEQAYRVQTLVPQAVPAEEAPTKEKEEEPCAKCHTTEPHPITFDRGEGDEVVCAHHHSTYDPSDYGDAG